MYPTFVVAMAVVVGMLLTILLMPFWIRFLRSHLIGQQVLSLIHI